LIISFPHWPLSLHRSAAAETKTVELIAKPEVKLHTRPVSESFFKTAWEDSSSRLGGLLLLPSEMDTKLPLKLPGEIFELSPGTVQAITPPALLLV